jgi:hypothetical protein
MNGRRALAGNRFRAIDERTLAAVQGDVLGARSVSLWLVAGR